VAGLMKQAQADLASLEKLAGFAEEAAPRVKGLRDMAAHLAAPVLATLAATGTVGFMGYLSGKKRREEQTKALENSLHSAMSRSKSFDKNQELFIQRFGELTAISPTVAQNPMMASKIIEKKLKTGFNVDDIHRLSNLETSRINVERTGLPSAGAAGRAAASGAFKTIFKQYGDQYLDRFTQSGNLYESGRQKFENDRRAQRVAKAEAQASANSDMDPVLRAAMSRPVPPFKERPVGKEAIASTSFVVSEECLGTMLAERLLIFEEAGLSKEAGSFSQGAKHLGESLKYMLPALALGGGVELVRRVIDSRKNTKLQQQADATFLKIRKSSETMKAEPEIAQDAFNTLKAFAPTLAATPMVMKTFVEHVVNSRGHFDPNLVSQIADAEHKARGPKASSFAEGMSSTMGMMSVPKMSFKDAKHLSQSRDATAAADTKPQRMR
jgi:hypothetical protein